jgi:polyisoprenoid-binding protein YceI
MYRKFIVLAGLAALLVAQPLLAAEFKVDHAHTNVGFRVAHMVITKVNGSFNEFDASFHYDPEDMSMFSLTATIQVASIDTNNDQRDNHLRSSDFFDAASHPTITFQSTGLSMMGDGYVLKGDFTIRGVTKAVEMPITITGPVEFGGNVVIGVSGSMTINRHDFGVSWSRSLDNGGLVVANEIDIQIDAEFTTPKGSM